MYLRHEQRKLFGNTELAKTHLLSRTATPAALSAVPSIFQNSSQFSEGIFFSLSRPMARRKELGVVMLSRISRFGGTRGIAVVIIVRESANFRVVNLGKSPWVRLRRDI